MHLLVVGGGSAGHVVPALPVIERFAQQGAMISFIGTHSGLEASLLESGLPTTPVSFYAISAGKLRRYLSFENVTDLFRIALGVWQAWRLIGRIRPDVVFSKGGFVALPVAFAAWVRRVPVVAHESDLTPGLANRLSKPFVRTLCTSFAETRFGSFAGRIVHTGSPLRPELLLGTASAGRRRLAFAQAKPILLVTGGSLGADSLNRIVRAALAELTVLFNVVHVCGKGKLEAIDDPSYQQFEYVGEGWGDMLAAADVVVSRAGANALFELISLRKVCLLVPLSARASRGDQIANAQYAQDKGLARVVQETDLDARVLCREIAALQANRTRLEDSLRAVALPDAVTLLCEEIERVVA